MWSEGQYASPALQMFVEERNTMLFDKEAQGYNDTRDLFTAAPIRGGVGRSSLRIFADGQHSKVLSTNSQFCIIVLLFRKKYT